MSESLTNICCGSLCLVAGSNKCCRHEIAEEEHGVEWEFRRHRWIQRTPVLPQLNVSFGDDAVFLEFLDTLRSEDKEILLDPTSQTTHTQVEPYPPNVASIPLPLSTKDRSGLKFSKTNWPELSCLAVPEKGGKDAYQLESLEDLEETNEVTPWEAQEEDSLVILPSQDDHKDDVDSHANPDEWEVLSAAESVWTLRSMSSSTTDIQIDLTSKTFRDAVLKSSGRPSSLSGQSHPLSPMPKTHHQPPTLRIVVVKSHVSKYLGNDDHEDGWSEDLRDEYKSARGGKAGKRFHREKKGHHSGMPNLARSWDNQGRLLVRHRANQSTQRGCRHLTSH